LDFEFSDEQRQLHDAVERYLGNQYSFDRYKAIKGSAAGWDPQIWRKEDLVSGRWRRSL